MALPIALAEGVARGFGGDAFQSEKFRIGEKIS